MRQGGVKRGSRDYKKTEGTRGDSNDKSDKLLQIVDEYQMIDSVIVKMMSLINFM